MKAPAGRSTRRQTPRREKPASEDSALRKHVIELLRGGNAHVDFEQAVGGLPTKLRGARVPHLPFTPWKLLEHLRIAQRDILEFSRNPGHVSPNWPDGYWPAEDAPANSAAWDASVAAFQHDLKELQALVKNPSTNLFAPIPHGNGQTVLREALLAADHNAYHLGEFVVLRRLLGAWKAD
jgi:DinB superfamily